MYVITIFSGGLYGTHNWKSRTIFQTILIISDYRLSKFDWHDLSSIFLAIMLLHIPKSILETNKTLFDRYSLIQQS